MRWIASFDRSSVRAGAVLACLLASAPVTAATLPFEADLVLEIGGASPVTIGTVGSGVAIVNGSGAPARSRASSCPRVSS